MAVQHGKDHDAEDAGTDRATIETSGLGWDGKVARSVVGGVARFFLESLALSKSVSQRHHAVPDERDD